MSFDVPYGRFDRTLYRLAFANLDLQIALNGVEQSLFRASLKHTTCDRPVFITSLPRAGTTLLLDVLNTLPEFASPTYRQMPFALCPLLWPSISQHFHKRAEQTERAHGDGVKVGFDSPEAFEEIVWKAFWDNHYRADRIMPWTTADRDDVFEGYVADYMKKIVAAKGPTAHRYLSKNNANIARIGLLQTLFPDGTIVIPVRQPWAQAASLQRQHQHFRELHAEDSFGRDYMTWLGHFEFGAALRPIDIGGWVTELLTTPDDPAYWLTYWATVYEAVLAAPSDRLVLIDYDALCADPTGHLESLALALGIADPAALTSQASRFRASKPATIPNVALALIKRVTEIYQAVQERCLRVRDADAIGQARIGLS